VEHRPNLGRVVLPVVVDLNDSLVPGRSAWR
jgi:hypothetical protein